jgi:hypothetical protein
MSKPEFEPDPDLVGPGVSFVLLPYMAPGHD